MMDSEPDPEIDDAEPRLIAYKIHSTACLKNPGPKSPGQGTTALSSLAFPR
jgi:hypothetical protein